MSLPLTLIQIVLLVGTPAVLSNVSLKGVNPELIVKYQTSSDAFACLDGSKTIKAKQVNDDYCDCPDGSDEPGTSACPNSWFYCRNKGHEPKLLASQFVKDGVCDCCDGTDEPKGVCQNTCHLAIAAEKAKLQQSIVDYKQALAKKHAYVAHATARREEFASRATTIDAEIEQQTATVKHLEDEKERLEQEHKEKEDQARYEQEARDAEERERIAAEAEQQAAREALEVSEASDSQPAEEDAPEHASTEAEGQEPATTATEGHAEQTEHAPHEVGEDALSSEELGRKIASQWTNDPEAAETGQTEGQHDEDHPTAHEDEAGHDTVDSWQDDHDHEDHDFSDTFDLENDDATYTELVREWWEAAVARVAQWWRGLGAFLPFGKHTEAETHHGVEESEELKEVRRKYQAEKEKLEELERFRAEATTVKGVDLGLYDEFLELSGKCFSSHETQFTYEACFFNDATQREGQGSKTTIGKWKGFEAGHTVAVFDDGDWCWQAPNRSLRLQLECGQAERLYNLEEPSRCVYQGKFQTPAACAEDGVQQLEAHLAHLHQLEEEIKNEDVHEEL